MADDIQIQKMDGKSLDVTGVNKEKLKTVFPECFTEGNLDIDKLLSLCGEYIDNDFEKYKFEWKGKSECYRIAGNRSTGTLRPCPEESVDFENTNNLYIEGDNLEVLKLLQTAYYRKVKMIYIDPPYNTGKDFVYEDDFKDPLAKYKEITSQTTKSNPETMGRYHTNWLNMMYPRLRLASNLLRDDGVIFISIDDNEVTNLRKICDEIFGEENFVADFIRKGSGGRQDSKYYAIVHEYLLCYAKSITSFVSGKDIKEDDRYPFFDSAKGKNYKTQLLRKWGENSRRIDRPNLYFPIKDPDGNDFYPMLSETEEGCWRWGQTKMQEAINDGIVEFKKKNGQWIAYEKIYEPAEGENTKLFTTWIDNITSASGASLIKELFNDKVFDYPKPLELLTRVIKLSNANDDDIILDFFSGSSTTAHAVMQLNAEDSGKRQFIMVQLPELTDNETYKNICEIGKERIRRAGSKIKEQNTDVDVGFKVLKLDTSNLVKWDDTPVSETEVLKERFDSVVKTLKFDRSELDVVYEVMLKLGIPVTYKVNLTDINGRKVYSIGDDGLILVCLDGSNGGITPEDISAMCDLTPAKIVAAEEAFKDDVALSNAYYISKDKGVEIELL